MRKHLYNSVLSSKFISLSFSADIAVEWPVDSEFVGDGAEKVGEEFFLQRLGDFAVFGKGVEKALGFFFVVGADSDCYAVCGFLRGDWLG